MALRHASLKHCQLGFLKNYCLLVKHFQWVFFKGCLLNASFNFLLIFLFLFILSVIISPTKIVSLLSRSHLSNFSTNVWHSCLQFAEQNDLFGLTVWERIKKNQQQHQLNSCNINTTLTNRKDIGNKNNHKNNKNSYLRKNKDVIKIHLIWKLLTLHFLKMKLK